MSAVLPPPRNDYSDFFASGFRAMVKRSAGKKASSSSQVNSAVSTPLGLSPGTGSLASPMSYGNISAYPFPPTPSHIPQPRPKHNRALSLFSPSRSRTSSQTASLPATPLNESKRAKRASIIGFPSKLLEKMVMPERHVLDVPQTPPAMKRNPNLRLNLASTTSNKKFMMFGKSSTRKSRDDSPLEHDPFAASPLSKSFFIDITVPSSDLYPAGSTNSSYQYSVATVTEVPTSTTSIQSSRPPLSRTITRPSFLSLSRSSSSTAAAPAIQRTSSAVSSVINIPISLPIRDRRASLPANAPVSRTPVAEKHRSWIPEYSRDTQQQPEDALRPGFGYDAVHGCEECDDPALMDWRQFHLEFLKEEED